jgi:hypothetical protein
MKLPVFPSAADLAPIVRGEACAVVREEAGFELALGGLDKPLGDWESHARILRAAACTGHQLP